MISRTALITGLLLVEGAIICEMVFAVRGQPQSWSPFQADAATTSGSRLVEDAPARKFSFLPGSHPALSIDIGNADLVIRAVDTFDVAVSLSSDPDLGMFGSSAPISAMVDGDTVRIEGKTNGWAPGDDRLLTVVVPAQTRVTVINAGDIKTEGLRADATINTRRGKVRMEDFDSGSLHITANDEAISLDNVNASHLDVTTDDGDISGTGIQAQTGTVETSDGKVRLGFVTGTDTLVSAATDDGKVLVSGFDDGAVDVKNGQGDASSETVHIGDAKGRFTVHSGDGDIEISQS